MPDPTQSVADAMAEVRERTGPPPQPTPEQKALCDDGECGGCIICYGPGVPVFGPSTVIALADEIDRLSALLAGEGVVSDPTPVPVPDEFVAELNATPSRDAATFDLGEGTPDRTEWTERFRKALMRFHHHDWDMETVSEAAHICAQVVAGEGTTQPDAAEPTATQLYDAVKAKRYDRNAENPILTIPEIHAVLAARAEWLADRASGEGTAPPPAKVDAHGFTDAEHDTLTDLIQRNPDRVRRLLELHADHDAPSDADPLTFTYTNHAGVTAERRIVPRRVEWGSTEWHPAEQWFLVAHDLDRDAERWFPMAEIAGRGTAPQVPAEAEQP